MAGVGADDGTRREGRDEKLRETGEGVCGGHAATRRRVQNECASHSSLSSLLCRSSAHRRDVVSYLFFGAPAHHAAQPLLFGDGHTLGTGRTRSCSVGKATAMRERMCLAWFSYPFVLR